MSFITYAQNGEDVLLWRALGHLKNGYYIDVGANDPELHSVTKAFYDAGWHGINIEPMPSYRPVFAQQRPRDINLAVACGASEGEITLFDVPDMNGWASTDDAVARNHRADGHAVTEVSVPLRTLTSICDEYVRGEIHFLKIDVEGFEGEVLRGMDLRRWRPWVLVIEATLPGQRATNHDSWEQLVLPHDYHFSYFDGLNRYYVAGEHRELLQVLNLQANVFDDYISYHLERAWRGNEQLTESLKASQLVAYDAAQESLRARQQTDQAQQSTQLAHAQARQLIDDVSRTTLERDALHTALMAARQALEDAGARDRQHSEQLQQQADAAQRQSLWAGALQQRLLEIEASRSWRLLLWLGRLPTLPRRLLNRIRRKAHGALRRVAKYEPARRVLIPLHRSFPGLSARVLALVRVAERPPAAAAFPIPGAEAGAPAFSIDLSAEPASVRAALRDLLHAIHPPSR